MRKRAGMWDARHFSIETWNLHCTWLLQVQAEMKVIAYTPTGAARQALSGPCGYFLLNISNYESNIFFLYWNVDTVDLTFQYSLWSYILNFSLLEKECFFPIFKSYRK